MEATWVSLAEREGNDPSISAPGGTHFIVDDSNRRPMVIGFSRIGRNEVPKRQVTQQERIYIKE